MGHPLNQMRKKNFGITSKRGIKTNTTPENSLYTGIMIKELIDCLRKARGWVTQSSLRQVIGTEISNHPNLLKILKNHSRILFKEEKYKFIDIYPAWDKNEIVACLRKNPFGILRRDICENYPNVNKDLLELVKEGSVFIIKEVGCERDTDVVFYRDDMEIYVDEDIKSLLGNYGPRYWPIE